METIVAAAVTINASAFSALTVSASPSARHHNIIHSLYDYGIKVGPEQQGFITSTGRFVSREEALDIVFTSGQKYIEHDSNHPTQLFSEDLW